MFRPNDNSRGIQGLRTRGFRKVVSVLALALGTGGCLVTASTYEAKTREADTLREAVAFANKEKGTIETRLLASEKQISSAKEENTVLSGRKGQCFPLSRRKSASRTPEASSRWCPSPCWRMRLPPGACRPPSSSLRTWRR